jgi:hypothetical protein
VREKLRPDGPHLAIEQEQTKERKKAPETSPSRKPFSVVWQHRDSHFRESQSSAS